MTTLSTVAPTKKHLSQDTISALNPRETKKTRKKIPLSIKYKKDLEDMKAGKNCVSRDELAKQYL